MSSRIGGRSSASYPSGLHESQRKLSPNASAHEISQANDDAMKAAVEASLTHDDGLTEFQRFARETGDPELMQQANDEALAIGIHRSVDGKHDVPKSARKSIPQEEFHVQHKLLATFRNLMKKLGFDIKPNNGNRNNCLIISMLQHATGNYDSNHEEQAKFFKQKVFEWSGGKEKSSSALHSDDALFRQLIDAINRHYFKEQKELYLRFTLATPDLDGKPTIREVGDGPRVAGIIDGAGHYEAYVKSDARK